MTHFGPNLGGDLIGTDAQDARQCPSTGPRVGGRSTPFLPSSPKTLPPWPTCQTPPPPSRPPLLEAWPRAPLKKKPKKELTPKERARESEKRANQRAKDAKRKAAANATLLAAAAQRYASIKENETMIVKSMQKVLLMLGFGRPMSAILTAGTMAAASTSSSAIRPPRAGSPRSSRTLQMAVLQLPHEPAATRPSTSPGCSAKVSMVAPPTPFPRSLTSTPHLCPAPASRPPRCKRSGLR